MLTSTLMVRDSKPTCLEKDMIMKFYNSQHEFYCGIDLHANSMHVCVVDSRGSKQLHQNFNTKTPDRFLDALSPYRDHDLIAGCESTFNWYWLADLCSVEGVGRIPCEQFPQRITSSGRAHDRCMKQPDCRCRHLAGQSTDFANETKSIQQTLNRKPTVNRESPAVRSETKSIREKTVKLLPRGRSALLDKKGHTDVICSSLTAQIFH